MRSYYLFCQVAGKSPSISSISDVRCDGLRRSANGPLRLPTLRAGRANDSSDGTPTKASDRQGGYSIPPIAVASMDDDPPDPFSPDAPVRHSACPATLLRPGPHRPGAL